MGKLVEFHESYMKRLANIYLDIYDMYGHEAAAEWHKRTLAPSVELKRRLRAIIKEEAPKRGKVIKE